MPSHTRKNTPPSFGRFTDWLQRLNAGGYFAAYGSRGATTDWADRLQALHTDVVEAWPMLWGVLSQTQIKSASQTYLDRFPFLDRTRKLPSGPFVEAMLLADEAQVALKSDKVPALTCAECVVRQARIALLETQLQQSKMEPLPFVSREEDLLETMWLLYNRVFMHGVGCTPRDVVRAAVLESVARNVRIDLHKQPDIWKRFVNERLLDEAQHDRKFINCCHRIE